MDYDELITRVEKGDEGSGNIKITLNLRTTYNDEGKAERASEMAPPGNVLQFITITDPRQSRIPRNKRIVRSQAMRYARNQLRPSPQNGQSSSRSGASGPPALNSHCPNIQPPGVATCCCIPGNDVCRSPVCHEAPSIGPVAAARYPSPLSVLGSGRVDPFGSFPVKMSPYMNFLLDYYAQISGQVQLVYAGSCSVLSASLVPLARSSEATLHGLLCLAASRVTVGGGGQAPRPWEIYHHCEAIKLITAGLSDPVKAISDEMVITIAFICGYDILFGHYNDLETHLRGIERIVAVRGGLDKLGYNGVVRLMVSWVNYFRRKPKRARSPKISALAPPQPAILQIRAHVSWFMDSTGPLVPSGIRKITLKGLISLEAFKSINILCSIFIEANATRQKTPAGAVKLSERCREVERNLDEILHGPSQTVCEELCIRAIIIFKHMTFTKLTPWASPVVGLSRDLKNTLERTDLSLYWRGEFNFMLWVLFIGYASGHMQEHKAWFASLIRGLILNTSQNVGIVELEAILKGFLYSEAHFGAPCMELWTWLGVNS